ncbi:MAG: hypothetical protein ACI808_000528 [Paraglaciecola sp.]|jgi:uncharacterized protein (DUF1800 family)
MDQVRRMLLKGFACVAGSSVILPVFSSNVFAANTYVSSAVANEVRTKAARLANYATFGANETTVNHITNIGWEAWIDEQLSMPITLLYPSATLSTDKPTQAHHYSAWWTNAMVAPDQLQQRVGFALSQWFVISSHHPFLSGRDWTTINFHDMLLKGGTGSFVGLLNQVSTHPAMCAYLSSLYNKKADPESGTIPDENYAREMMQLFTCGAEKRYQNGNFAIDAEGNRKPNYTENDVQELARVFTGIGIKDAKAWGKEGGDWLSPVIEYPEYHDDGSKRFMGETIPQGLSLEGDIKAALDIILEQRTNSVAGNFSRFMIQQLTISNPRGSYVRDVSIVFKESNWDMKSMVKAIMLHPDAIDGRSNKRCETGRIKEPLLWYASARRAIAPPRDKILLPYTGPLLNHKEPETGVIFNQAPLAAPSVFGFFPRDYQPESIRGEHTDYIQYTYPEAYIYDWNNIVTISNKLWGNIIKKDDDVADFYDALTQSGNNELFADYVLDRLLFGNYRAVLRDELIILLNSSGPTADTAKVRDALVLVTSSPDFLIINLPQEI